MGTNVELTPKWVNCEGTTAWRRVYAPAQTLHFSVPLILFSLSVSDRQCPLSDSICTNSIERAV